MSLMAVPITNMKLSHITAALGITNQNVKPEDIFLSPNIIGSGLDPTYCPGADGYQRIANLRNIVNLGGIREFKIGKFRNYNPVSVFYKQGHFYTNRAFHHYGYTSNCVHVPSGWHIATVSDMSNIIDAIESGNSFSSNTVGKYLKSTYLTDDTPFSPSPAWVGLMTNYDIYNFKAMASGICEQGTNVGDPVVIGNIGSYGRIWMKYSDSLNYISQFTDTSNSFQSIGVGNFKQMCQIRLVKDDSVNTGSVIDIDGNVYKTIKIGDTVITAEGIRTTKNALGSSLTTITVGNSASINDLYGYLSIANTDIP